MIITGSGDSSFRARGRDRGQRQAAPAGGPAIRKTGLGGPDAAYRFRHAGLKLVVRSGGEWCLPPAGWTPGNRGAALLLPDTDDLRVEFAPGR